MSAHLVTLHKEERFLVDREASHATVIHVFKEDTGGEIVLQAWLFRLPDWRDGVWNCTSHGQVGTPASSCNHLEALRATEKAELLEGTPA